VSAPDLTRKVIGFRSWSPTDADELTALAKGTVWGRGTNTARCVSDATGYFAPPTYPYSPRREPCKHAPSPQCTCGIYAYHAPHLKQTPPPWSQAPLAQVHGAVAAWGRMEVHKNGFRTEHAEIIALGFHPDWPLRATQRLGVIADNYCVPAVALDALAEVAAEVGEAIPESLYPEIPPPPTREEIEAYNEAAKKHMAAYYDSFAPQLPSPKRRWWQRTAL